MKIFTKLNAFGKAANHDRIAYRDYQIKIGEYYFENIVHQYSSGNKIFDIGCAEGGVLTAFEQKGYTCSGLEYSEQRVDYAKKNSAGNITFYWGDIQNFEIDEKFDVVLMLDVIEHLDNKVEALENIKKLLKSDGIFVISFPPFRSAFGGHQQVMRSFLKYIPYIHLVPKATYRWLLKNIEKNNVEAHFRNYQTGLTIKEFEKILNITNFKVITRKFHFVRPRQALRFNIKMRPYALSWFREYFASGAIFVLKKNNG